METTIRMSVGTHGETSAFRRRDNEENHRRLGAACEERHAVLDLGRVRRLALTVHPHLAVERDEQVREAVSTLRAVLEQQPVSMTATVLNVFVRSAEEVADIRCLMEADFTERMPAVNFIVQPPCGGQAVALEAWAIGGEGVHSEFLDSGAVTVEYDGLKWIYTNGIHVPMNESGAYVETQEAFEKLARSLESAGVTFNDVTRTWLYQGGITEAEVNTRGESVERYRELNRSRTDFFEQLEESGTMSIVRDGRACYPASTGIGMHGSGLKVSCMALQTKRNDVRLIPLENPNQTPAFDYERRFSVKSPKFSRAMAVLIDNYVTVWISGTASILDSESVHAGDIEKQTEQTIDNIEALISPDNFRRHGIEDAGALLSDLARIRVYVKRVQDYEKCRAVCERRFGAAPAVYVVADVCRPELLVEIEGVAFFNRAH